MKKQIIYSLAALMMAGTMTSCKQYGAQTAVLNDMNDSINYALGYSNGDGIKNYYMNDVEEKDLPAAVKAFVEALDKAYNSDATPDEIYQLGVQIGSSFKQQEAEGLMGEESLKFNTKLAKQGLEDGLTFNNDSTAWTAAEAQAYIQATMMQLQAEKAAKAEAEQAAAKAAVEEETVENAPAETK